MQFTETSSVGGSVTYSLNQIVRAEPDPTLFTVPADYKVQNLPPGVELHPSTASVESRVSTGYYFFGFRCNQAVALATAAVQPVGTDCSPAGRLGDHLLSL